MNFTELNLLPELIEGIGSMGYQKATPIQEQVIPTILEGRDVIASAQTGTGKTAAFLLPVINKIITGPPSEKIKAIVIVPTRELAVQIDQQMEGLSYFTPISSIAVYGGGDGNLFERERHAMKNGVDIVICTPGRMLSHLEMKYIDFSALQFLVLDEADRMLDMGFSDDLNKIFSFLPAKKQSLLFSATMPPKIRALARNILQNPVEVSIAVSKPNEKIVQQVFYVGPHQKIPLVKHLLDLHKFRSVLIFCSSKNSVRQLSQDLKRAKLKIEEIHSGLEQKQREEVLMQFRNRELEILVATDILSRGIDIEDIDMVINFDVPHEGEDYIHRIGRTARAAAKGIAYTLVDPRERKKFKRIEDLLGKQVERGILPEGIKESDENAVQTGQGENRGNNRHGGNKKRNFPPRNGQGDPGKKQNQDPDKTPGNGEKKENNFPRKNHGHAKKPGNGTPGSQNNTDQAGEKNNNGQHQSGKPNHSQRRHHHGSGHVKHKQENGSTNDKTPAEKNTVSEHNKSTDKKEHFKHRGNQQHHRKNAHNEGQREGEKKENPGTQHKPQEDKNTNRKQSPRQYEGQAGKKENNTPVKKEETNGENTTKKKSWWKKIFSR